ncbi:MAG: hypothetical protein MR543_05930 [Robinsoniella sp.]|nr:hypothetical protein [Robinsoniella sp.]
MWRKRKWSRKCKKGAAAVLAAALGCTVIAADGLAATVETSTAGVAQQTETSSGWRIWDAPETGMEQREELSGTLAQKAAVWKSRMEAADAAREDEKKQQEAEEGKHRSGIQMDEYIKITDDSYRPMEQGYYGYFPVRYENGSTTMNTAVPALVKEDHTYFNAEDICQRLGIEYVTDSWSDVFQVNVRERQIIFWKDSGQVNLQIGPFLMEYTMPVETVYQDDIFWIGAEWFFWMVGGTFFPLPDGYVAIGAPQESALDVIAELYGDDGAFDYTSAFGLSKEGLTELDKALKRLDVYDGLLNFELDKWAAVLDRYQPEAFITESTMYDLITESSYGADFMELLLEITPDESYAMAETSQDIAEESLDTYLEYMENFYETYSKNTDNLATVAARYADMAFNEGNLDFAEALGRYSNNKICESIDAAAKSDVYNAIGKAAKGFFVLKDIVDCWNNYSNRDLYSMEGASAVMEIVERNDQMGINELPLGVMRSMNMTLETYQLGKKGFTFTTWFTENIGDYAGDVLTGMLGIAGAPITAYQLGSRLIPQYVTSLKEAEAFEMSLIGILYQSPAYTAFFNEADKCFQRKTPSFSVRDENKPFEVTYNEDALDGAVAQAYHYVKTRYVTRELALVTLQVHSENPDYQAQEALQERELERIEALMDYCKEDLPLPSQWDEKSADYDDSYLEALVTPAYLHVTGSFVDAQTGEGISEVSVSVKDQAGNVMTEFTSKDGGAFDCYIPLEWKEECAQQLEKELDFEGAFIPWKEPYKRSFAYPSLGEEAPLTWKCTAPDSSEFTKDFSELEMTDLEGQAISRELKLDTGKISLGIDYYGFIRDELVPEMGFVSLGYAQNTVNADFSQANWDQRKGLLGADIADLNMDGTEDLLVYYIADDKEFFPFSNGTYSKGIYAELYSVNKEGEIIYIAQRKVYSISDMAYERMKIGLMEREGRVFLYVEGDAYAYFANGGSVAYTWYSWDEKGALRPWWMIGQTDGGSTGLASSVLDYYDAENYDKYVLCADGEFRYMDSEVEVLTDEADNYAYNTEMPLRAGFYMLGLNAPGIYGTSENTYFTQNGRMLTLWGTELMKESVGYLSTGTRQGDGYSVRDMTIFMEDRTGLREKTETISSDLTTR